MRSPRTRSSRTVVPLLGWLAATLTSIVLASVAMLPVLRTATGGEGELISADQLGPADQIPLPAVPSGPSPAPAPSRSPAAGPGTATAPTSDSPTPSGTGSETSRPSRTTPPPRTTPPTSKPAATVIDGWTVTTDGDGVRTFLRSFQVDGGHAVIRAADGRITLVTATPSNGFEVATVQNSPDNLAVYFNETNHSFIIHVVWNVDRPFAQIDEIGG